MEFAAHPTYWLDGISESASRLCDADTVEADQEINRMAEILNSALEQCGTDASLKDEVCRQAESFIYRVISTRHGISYASILSLVYKRALIHHQGQTIAAEISSEQGQVRRGASVALRSNKGVL
jgi:hypothetical protein